MSVHVYFRYVLRYVWFYHTVPKKKNGQDVDTGFALSRSSLDLMAFTIHRSLPDYVDHGAMTVLRSMSQSGM